MHPISLAFALIFLFALQIHSPVFAADKFGQIVSADLEQMVLKARRKRLPYAEDQYDPQASVNLLTEVTKKRPDYFRAHFNLGLAYHELGSYEKSVEHFDKAMQIRKELNIADNSVVNTAGWVSMKNGDFERAEKLLKQAEALTTGDGTFTERAVISNLGELYFLTQRFGASRKYFHKSKYKFGNSSAEYFLNIIETVEKKSEEN